MRGDTLFPRFLEGDEVARIDGRRPLAAVFKKVSPPQIKRALSFIAYLVRCESAEWTPISHK